MESGKRYQEVQTMKRLFSLLLVIAMISALVPALAMVSSADGTSTDLLQNSVLTHTVNSATWTFNGDGTLTGSGNGDNAIMSDVQVPAGKHVYIEVTAKLDASQAWGIIFSTSSTDPFGNTWYCYNIDSTVPNSRLFRVNGFTEYFDWRTQGFKDGEYHTLGMEFMGDGTLKFYYDDDGTYMVLNNSELENLYIGVMVCNSTTTFKSFTMDTAKQGAGTYEKKSYLKTTDLIADGVLKYKQGDGSYSVENGVLTASNRSFGDTFFSSDVRVEKGEHVYIEATGTMAAKERDSAWGILLSADKETPGASWLCLNVDGTSHRSRLFRAGSDAVGSIALDYDPFIVDVINNVCTEEITLGIEITEDGVFYLVCNGVQFAHTAVNNWNGAYVGLMTWFSELTVTSAKLYELGEFEVEVAQDDQTIDAGEAVTVSANAPIDSVTVGETVLEENSDYTVDGNSITISGDFTEKLSAGTYSVTVTSGENIVTVRFTVNATQTSTADPDPVPTGDIASITVAAVALIALAGATVAATKRKIDR